jgi:uncharacterized membrane protein
MNTPNGTVPCPACGSENMLDRVFCVHCHKALGEFRYIREEFEASTCHHQKVAERITGFLGRPVFLISHAVLIGFWIFANLGLVMFLPRFDDYPFNLLGFLLSVEALFITGFVLIAQNRQSAFADLRAELDYEVNVRTYREVRQIRQYLAKWEAEHRASSVLESGKENKR